MIRRQDIERQYASSDPLKARMETHRLYSERQIDLDEECHRVMALLGDEAILDVGCGPGFFMSYLRQSGHRGRLVGLDQSAAMIAEARARDDTVEWLVCDATALPFAEGEFDWIVARHMLYYIDDVPACLRGFARVLKSDGGFLAMTNARRTNPGIGELADNLFERFGVSVPERAIHQRDSEAFSVDNAVPTLRTVWTEVEESILDNAFVFTSHEPIVRYIVTLLPSMGAASDPAMRAEMIDWLDREAAERLEEYGGVWRDPKVVGLYVCRDPA